MWGGKSVEVTRGSRSRYFVLVQDRLQNKHIPDSLDASYVFRRTRYGCRFVRLFVRPKLGEVRNKIEELASATCLANVKIG